MKIRKRKSMVTGEKKKSTDEAREQHKMCSNGIMYRNTNEKLKID